MALNSVKFRIEGDGTSALKALNDVKRGMGDVKNVMAQEITQKIKQAFSVGAIEEMTRRTAEWATNLTNTAKRLQVTTQELQGFQLAGSRIGMETGKVEGFFNTLEDSSYEALKGNAQLLISFQKLGIGMDDLRKKAPAQLFEKVLGGLGSAKGIQGAQEIFGRGDTVDLQRLSATLGGQSGAEFAHKSGLAVGDNDLQEITVAWRGVLEGIKGIGVQLLPLVKVILAIVDGLVKMVGGILGTVTGIVGDLGTMAGQMSAGDWKGAAKTFGKMTVGRLSNMGAGIAKAATLGFANKQIDEWMKPGNDLLEKSGMGLTNAEKGHSEGAGEGIATALLAGGPKIGEGAIGFLARKAEDRLRNFAANRAGIAADKFAQSLGYEDELEMMAAHHVGKEMVTGTPELRIPTASEMQQLNRIQNASAESWLAQFGMKNFGLAPGPTRFSYGVGMTGQLGGLASSGAADISNRLKGVPGSPAFAGRNPMMTFNGFGTGGGSGSGNLRIGGVFGTDVSFKIIQLNQEMVTIMSRMLAIMEGDRNPSQYITPTGLY